jgi:spermidine synthase
MTPLPSLSAFAPADTGTAAASVPSQHCLKPFVHDDGTVRSLHFTLGELQSRMNTHSPWQLEVDYTRTMMGFLLFTPAPSRMAMVGLGGGSLAKFCYRQLPGCLISVVEINPHVIALRGDFQVPEDDGRFQVIEDDGAAFVASRAEDFDTLLVDGFDHEGQPAQLCSQGFYDNCFTALAPGGVLAVNLHCDDPDYAIRVGRIQRSFGGNAVEIYALEKSNCIVFASRGAPISPRRINLTASLSGLDSEARLQLRPEFTRIAWCMKDLEDLEEAI